MNDLEKAYKILGLDPKLNPTHYQVLGLEKNASLTDIKKAYKKRSLAYHPDKYKDNDEVFKLISAAGSTLQDKDEKAKYDASLSDRNESRSKQKEGNEESYFTLESLLKRIKVFSQNSVSISNHFRDGYQEDQTISTQELLKAIDEKNDKLVIPELEKRILAKLEGPDTERNLREIEDILSLAPEYNDSVTEAINKKLGNAIIITIQAGSGWFFDSEECWKKVEHQLKSIPEEYRVEIVSHALKGIDNTSRRDKLLDFLPESQRSLAMANIQPTVLQAVRDFGALLRGDAGFEYNDTPHKSRTLNKARER